MGGISIWQILIVVLIVAILFGGKRLRNLGNDLGTSLKGFKKAMKEEDKKTLESKAHQSDTAEQKNSVEEK